MKNVLSIVLILLVGLSARAQAQTTYKSGEWFKFRIHYGVFTASYATLEVKDAYVKGKPVYHVNGIGKSTGLLSLFFKVDDNYQSYIDKTTGDPVKFIRKIDEGGYTKDIQIDFDHHKKTALVHDKKHNKKSKHTIKPSTQDMISSFYYLRDYIDDSKLKKGKMVSINMFFDKTNYDFRLKYLGKETIDTKFGNVSCLKFRPYVQSGRVFKEEESLTVWISADKNKLPIRIKADLAIGSLKADLEAFKGLKHPFKILVN